MWPMLDLTLSRRTPSRNTPCWAISEVARPYVTGVRESVVDVVVEEDEVEEVVVVVEGEEEEEDDEESKGTTKYTT